MEWHHSHPSICIIFGNVPEDGIKEVHSHDCPHEDHLAFGSGRARQAAFLYKEY